MFRYIICLWTLLASTALQGVMEPIALAGFHEAFIPRDNGPALFSAVGRQPPEKIAEKIPPQTLPEAIWIPGYWSWYQDNDDFVWITGVWRVPPPGMTWISGLWQYFEDSGWVWLNGFWSPVPLEQLQPIQAIPPDPQEERPEFPESSNFFWNPGHWEYDAAAGAFTWLGGNWEPLDPNWVLAPAHYEWRPGGYLSIPSYWDWPVDRRGRSYLPLVIPKVNRAAEFEPAEIHEESKIYLILILYYPNYLYVCHHYYHYHPEMWSTIAPTWWQWHSWWSLPWKNQWGLWWWYTHSDYPQPAGLTLDIAERMRPANPRLLQMMRDAHPPAIVTPKGVVSPQALVETLEKRQPSGERWPIMPSSAKEFEKVQEEAAKVVSAKPVREREEREVEPSKRGKLHGIREAVPFEEQSRKGRGQGPQTTLPRKPILTPGEKHKASIAPHDEGEKGAKRIKANTTKVDIQLTPVKELKEARGQPNDKGGKGRSPQHIQAPDPSIIKQVLPGPRVGPPVDLGDPSAKKKGGSEAAPADAPPHQGEKAQDKPAIPNLRG